MTSLVQMLRWYDEQADDVEEPDEVLRTTTISSVVADEDEQDLGHVLMLDYDDVDPLVPIQDARSLDGLTAVSRSSPGSYHVLDLRVCRWYEVVERARSTRASGTYIEDMADRGEFALRVGPKLTKDGEDVEVSAPVPVAVDPGDVRLDRPLSEPHVEVLLDLVSGRGPEDVERDLRSVLDSRESVGDLLVRETRRVGLIQEGGRHG
jgi:hypothetical protein